MNIIRTLCLLTLTVCLFIANSYAQHPLDKFLSAAPVTKVIGTSADGLNNPADLDFCRIPGRTDELWVLNREQGSSSMTIFFHAGKPNQVSQYRKDSHSDHFMIYSSAMAMGANGNFGTVQEVQNSLGSATSTFMGPVLWMSDTSVFARMYQSNWANGQPLGSHIDMLHQSPFSMGIAADKDNIYWVFDGYNGNLVKYDFATPHTIGGDDHADGRVWRYPEVELVRTPNLPAHMVLDSASGWLYIVDNANASIIRVNTKTGVKARDLTPKDEPLALYWEMKNVTQEVYIDTGLITPVGIDIWKGRLVVTDLDKHSIRIYDATGAKGKYLGSIATNDEAIMGVKIGPDSNLWYVDASANTVTRLTPGVVPKSVTLLSPLNNATNVPVNGMLTWQTSGTFDSVRVVLSSVVPNMAIVDTTMLPVNQLAYASLELGKNYRWSVVGINSGESTTSSASWQFTTEVEAPGIPVLISPADLSTNIADTVTLVWDASQNATYYQVQLSKQNDFTTLDLTVDSTIVLAQVVSALTPNTQYFWRVRAFNELTNSNWSPAWSFTTATSSVDDNEVGFAVNIFPNPMQSSLKVVYTLLQQEAILVELVNALGMTIHRDAHTGSIGANEVTISRNGLPAGSYLLRLHIGEQTINRSIVILP